MEDEESIYTDLRRARKDRNGRGVIPGSAETLAIGLFAFCVAFMVAGFGAVVLSVNWLIGLMS